MNLIKRDRTNWLDPFDFVTDLQEEMNRLLSSSLRRTGDGFSGLLAPEMDLIEEENQYIIKADLPGLRKEDVDISISGRTLTLKGERKEETEKKGKTFFRAERRYGAFQRMIEFPTEVEANQVKATYKDGVLELIIPKAESAKPKQIKVDLK